MSSAEPAFFSSSPALIFAALGDETRLSIIKDLSDGSARSISALAVDKGLTRQAVTKHLHVLQEAGLVSSTRLGRESRFELRPEALRQARSYLESVAAQWDDALGRLRLFVEDPAGRG
ncbi:ArsR/SmtB family transcription factor [Enterovirga sp. CN4-39]|uniref:ArsR/SmtB family transcription factor n=1 Tax=Enterovirga sp. CN4-39 TaxID=3400910 RepID=UPI003BFBBE47